MRFTSLATILLSFILVCLLGSLAAGPALRSFPVNIVLVYEHLNLTLWPTPSHLIINVVNTCRATTRQNPDVARFVPSDTVDVNIHVVNTKSYDDDEPASWLDVLVKIQANGNILPAIDVATIINIILFIDALILAFSDTQTWATSIVSEMIPKATAHTRTLVRNFVANIRGIHKALDTVSQLNSDQLLAPQRHPRPFHSRRASLLPE